MDLFDKMETGGGDFVDDGLLVGADVVHDEGRADAWDSVVVQHQHGAAGHQRRLEVSQHRLGVLEVMVGIGAEYHIDTACREVRLDARGLETQSTPVDGWR